MSKTSQSASIRRSKRPIKKGWQPSQSNTHHTEKGGRGGTENNSEKTEIWRDAGGGRGGASPHERTQKNTYMMWRRETESEQSIQMCSSSNEQTETTTTRCSTHVQNTSDRVPTLDLTVHERRWRNEEWSKNKYRKSLDKKDRENGGCKYHSSKIKTNNKSKSNHSCETLPGIPDQCHTPERPRSTQPPTHTFWNQTDQKVKRGHLFSRNQNKKLQLISQWLSLHRFDLIITGWQRFSSRMQHVTHPMADVLAHTIRVHTVHVFNLKFSTSTTICSLQSDTESDHQGLSTPGYTSLQ